MDRAALAARMLEDFEARGVSEDLEELRAAWAPPPVAGGAGRGAGARTRGLRGQRPFEHHAAGRDGRMAAPALDRTRVRGGALDYRSGVRLEQLRALKEAARAAPARLGAPGWRAGSNQVAALGWGRESGARAGRDARPRPDAWEGWEAQWEEQLRHFGGLRALIGGGAGEERARAGSRHRPQGDGVPRRPSQQSAESSREQSGSGPPPPPPRRPRPTVQPREEPVVPERFATFAAFDEAYRAFEKKVIGDASGAQIGMDDIPWPPRADVCGARGEDSAGGRKKRVMRALLRFHPDKWQPLLSRVRPADAAKVADKIREVTRSILDEKKRFM